RATDIMATTAQTITDMEIGAATTALIATVTPIVAITGDISRPVERASDFTNRMRVLDSQRSSAVGGTLPVTRQIALPTSSATRSPPERSTATPTGRPRATPSSTNPVSTSSGSALGMPFSNGTKITL